MTSIPMDLILCVSKLWGSMLRRPYFTEMFLTRSLARPRLLMAVVKNGEWSFFSCPQPQNPYGKSSLVVGATFHMKFLSKGISHYLCSYASGLIYFPQIRISKENKDSMRVICNPSTGQYVILPTLITCILEYKSFLGFDPIDKQFKVLLISPPSYDDHDILTLGNGEMRWRKVQCPLNHYPLSEGICFNGVVFYLAGKLHEESYVIVCFDVRSETYVFMDTKHFRGSSYPKLLNYKGKLSGVRLKSSDDGGFQIFMWVLEDVEKQEWSKYVYTFRVDNKVFKVNNNLFVVGMTATGEIVLSKTNTFSVNSSNKPFYVFYFNPERNTLASVEIQGFGELHGFDVYGFVDHVEDFKFNFMKTNIYKSIK